MKADKKKYWWIVCKTKVHVNISNVDFYTAHPYDFGAKLLQIWWKVYKFKGRHMA